MLYWISINFGTNTNDILTRLNLPMLQSRQWNINVPFVINEQQNQTFLHS